ncbi:MAG: TldD/PmbA family protein [Candidatus Micrarchaeia archaeon]
MDAEKILSIAENKSGSAEVFLSRANSVSAFVDCGRQNMVIKNSEQGFGIRVFKDKKVGFAFGTLFDRTGVEETTTRAVNNAKRNRENPAFCFVDGKEKGFDDVDKKILNADEETITTTALEFTKTIEDQDGLQVPLASFKFSVVEYEIANSSNTRKKGQGTFFDAEPYVIAKEGGKRAETINRKTYRSFEENAVEELACESAELSKNSLHAKQLKTGKHDCIFHPGEFATLFDETYGYMLTAKAKYDNLALFAEGEQCASEEITVRDSITEKGTSASFACDQEGAFRKPLFLIDKGIFATPASDAFTAGLLETTPTANGRRSCTDHEHWYSCNVSCGLNNCVFEPGNRSFDELVQDTKKGVFVARTAYPLADEVSGRFTNEIRSGFYIENGEVKHPVKSTVVNGSVYDLLSKQLIGASREREVVSTNSYAFSTGAVAPYLKFKDVLFAGATT